MISPEAYYKQNLEGRTAKQIEATIRKLKREINKLKDIIENPFYDITQAEVYLKETSLRYTQKYLERAKKALSEAGGTYVPTLPEIRAAEFQNSIDYINYVKYSIGGFFGGYKDYIVSINDGHLYMHKENPFDIEHPECQPEADLPFTKEVFFDVLRKIHIGEWRKDYSPRKYGEMIMDGTQWSLEIHFSNNHKPLRIYGDNVFPYNFDELRELFGHKDEEEEYYED